MNDHPTVVAHVRELGAAYEVFNQLTDERLRREAARLVDFLGNEQVPVPADLAALPEAIPYLRAAVEAAHPDRKCMTLVAARGISWAQAVEPQARQAFLESLAPLGPAIHDLGEEGMGSVIAAANRDPRTIPCIAGYAMTNAKIIQAMARLAAGGAPVAMLQRLAGAVTVEKMEQSKDAERLVPAIAAVPEALPALVTLAEANVSSAFGAASALPKALKSVAEGDRSAYLNMFETLAASAGIGSVGFCLERLPALIAKHGAEQAAEFVALAAGCAREFGTRAAQSFLEQKTGASRML